MKVYLCSDYFFVFNHGPSMVSITTLQLTNVTIKKFILHQMVEYTCVLGDVTSVSNVERPAIVSRCTSFGSGISSNMSSGSDLSSILALVSGTPSLYSLSEFKSISSAADKLWDCSSIGDKPFDLSSSREMSALASTFICINNKGQISITVRNFREMWRGRIQHADIDFQTRNVWHQINPNNYHSEYLFNFELSVNKSLPRLRKQINRRR